MQENQDMGEKSAECYGVQGSRVVNLENEILQGGDKKNAQEEYEIWQFLV